MFQPCLSFAKIFRRCSRPFRYSSRALKTHRDFADDTATLSVLLRIQQIRWFSKSLDSLGAIISDDGIEVDPAKWERIRQWPTPHNKTDFSFPRHRELDARSPAPPLDHLWSPSPHY
ncbi:BZ3500_MvSof-1268-A1-R1_C121g00658 [Microbotryum saponariae]|uniref:BZ3500_MvSof-1268-A1-R1_C121g00658 protein n=1 Tax=Microbotryum saponariae TaxID=289078 RepID=A0A2X0LEJ3_9BASI|nr:BZ3500_MvSof-1268-A1-R1_C121g00658 [Microbotryum saponariae]